VINLVVTNDNDNDDDDDDDDEDDYAHPARRAADRASSVFCL